jgi:hypothetical protein
MSDISVILTAYKRDNIEQQLERIYNQTVDISDIYVYQNESHIDISHLKEKHDFKHVHSKDNNFKFHGRFTLPLLFDTKYTAIFDDDTMPNPKWLEHCMNLCEEKNCIVGANCRNYNNTGFSCGDKTRSPIKCDIVGHCWFFKTEWIYHMWREKPPTYETGEDINFCATCKINGGVDAYFPDQPAEFPEVWGDSQEQLGMDDHATYKKPNHNKDRFALYDYWIDKGWNVKK